MPESFGARLRQRRERQQIALTSIADQTKISLSLLEALERDDVSHWPAGIFRRSFIRAYARAIGLEPDAVVREFLELHPDPVEDVAAVLGVPPQVGDAGVSAGPPTRARYLVGSAIGSLSRVCLAVAQRRRSSVEAGPTPDRRPGSAAWQEELDLSATGEAPADRRTVSAASQAELDLSAATEPAVDRGSVDAPSQAEPDFSAATEPAADRRTMDAPSYGEPDHSAATEPTADRRPVDAPPQAESALSAATEPVADRRPVIASSQVESHPSAAGEPVNDRRPVSAPAQAEPDLSAVGEAVADRHAVSAPSQAEPDLSAAAHLCTELGCAYETREVAPLLEGAARILDAAGLIVWVWDPQCTELRPVLAHGYSDKLLAQLPQVRRDGDNATAAAFRLAQTRIVNGSDRSSGAMAVPLMTPVGCVGVLALELRNGSEQREPVRAIATIFAAQLAAWVGTARLADAVNA